MKSCFVTHFLAPLPRVSVIISTLPRLGITTHVHRVFIGVEWFFPSGAERSKHSTNARHLLLLQKTQTIIKYEYKFPKLKYINKVLVSFKSLKQMEIKKYIAARNYSYLLVSARGIFELWGEKCTGDSR